MKIHSLGHSSFLLELLPAASDRPVRILADPWLSDGLVGDLSGRFPRVRFSPRDWGEIDAVFISHAHTDHLDPYSLVPLWRELTPTPSLILPESLAFLEDVFREFLTPLELVYLHDQRPIAFRGVQLMGFFSPEQRATNEDDVMLLLAKNGRESFLSEADALFPFYDGDARAALADFLDLGAAQTICFLTTKNEGDATMAMLDAENAAERAEALGRELDRTYAEVHSTYAPPGGEEEDMASDVWQCDRVVRLIGGQGICFPQSLGTAWNRVLFPIRLRDRVEMEREVAAQYDCRHRVEEFVPGTTYELAGGGIESTSRWTPLQVLDCEDDRGHDETIELFEDFPRAPLRSDERDWAGQEARILDLLNDRFLPHVIGARNPPFEHLLAAGGGEYRVRVRFGTMECGENRDYVASFRALRFTAAEANSRADEHYFANDLEDVLDGHADEFSTICRRPPAPGAQRVWTTLGLPYLNNDLVERKIRLHFERAARGGTSESWVLAFYRDDAMPESSGSTAGPAVG